MIGQSEKGLGTNLARSGMGESGENPMMINLWISEANNYKLRYKSPRNCQAHHTERCTGATPRHQPKEPCKQWVTHPLAKFVIAGCKNALKTGFQTMPKTCETAPKQGFSLAHARARLDRTNPCGVSAGRMGVGIGGRTEGGGGGRPGRSCS
ncbi:hypothetical protein B0H13DRAFT_1963493 [Mycena leptocephala]|nr:hypothetical protein B0H13DRAFT_1963493 [Mycena leptocephala]